MSKNSKSIITVVVVIALVAVSFHFFNRNSAAYAKIIIKYNGSVGTIAQLTTQMQEEFLKAWSKALVKGKKSFAYEGGNYNTKGGTKITT